MPRLHLEIPKAAIATANAPFFKNNVDRLKRSPACVRAVWCILADSKGHG
jgi:hypothetical protein